MLAKTSETGKELGSITWQSKQMEEKILNRNLHSSSGWLELVVKIASWVNP